ncbi:MAG TPA: hypothetical protein PLJ35_06485 [Anaerolineae bacterium]|nr:hypothetical protein [Anaerolineae bacterium]HOQ98454.1 hypothetical protein [Anaerolineae bacterium]HPL26737.1 hypothetical protein [Anaerolineae bacterium]
MYKLRIGLAGVLLAVLIGCTPTPAAVTRNAAALSPQAVATSPGAEPATPVPTAMASPTPAASSSPQPSEKGPLAADGEPIKALALAAPGSPVRYALLADGVARSTDDGASWHVVSGLVVPGLLVSPHDARTLYAGASPSCYKDEPAPLFRASSDGGETWQDLPGGEGIRPVAEHPARPGLLYGTSCAGMSVSRDGGQTWEVTGPTTGWDITSILALPGEPLGFLAVLTSEGGSSHLAWFDEDGRLTRDLAEGLTFWGRGALAQAWPALYVADSTGVWRSDDAGAQWQQFKDGLADVLLSVDPLTDMVPEADWQRGYGLFALAVDPARPERLALGTVRGLYLSDDRGEHWQPCGAELLGQAKVSAVAWDPAAPGTLYATTPGGVYAVHVPAT